MSDNEIKIVLTEESQGQASTQGPSDSTTPVSPTAQPAAPVAPGQPYIPRPGHPEFNAPLPPPPPNIPGPPKPEPPEPPDDDGKRGIMPDAEKLLSFAGLNIDPRFAIFGMGAGAAAGAAFAANRMAARATDNIAPFSPEIQSVRGQQGMEDIRQRRDLADEFGPVFARREQAFSQLSRELEELSTRIGAEFAERLTPLIEILTSILDWTNNTMSDERVQIVNSILKLADPLSTIARAWNAFQENQKQQQVESKLQTLEHHIDQMNIKMQAEFEEFARRAAGADDIHAEGSGRDAFKRRRQTMLEEGFARFPRVMNNR